ncbi:ubiA prenyltransferase family protein isoform X2 [Tasmannia lanceolata]|uniref:ubiA prenyltransferase family protein isoform X2 n=1 Tax=Tasmannia lanceolata TaxID=3420 RepID=UPI004063BEF6
MAISAIAIALPISPFSTPPSRAPFLFSNHHKTSFNIKIPTKSLSSTNKDENPRLSKLFSSSSEIPTEGFKVEEKEEISKALLIWRAIKLPIYSVAVIPLTVGSAAAYLQTGIFFTRRYLLLLSSSVLIITWLNLSNDVYDFDTGADKDKKESVVNLVGSRTVTLSAANALLAIGFMGLIWASAGAGDIRCISLLTCAILCGYVYQCPPFRLSYQGLGEPLCFAAFGPFATTAFYFSQSTKSVPYRLPLTGAVLSASVLVGLTTALILFCSHFHQIDGDLAVGKMSPLVRMGTKTGSEVVKSAILTLYLLLVPLGILKALPLTCIDKIKIFMAKYYCVRLHSLFGAALAAGLVAGRTVTKANLPMLFPS